MTSQGFQVVDVFAAEAGGGNPAPIVLDAAGMTDDDMQGVARSTGHESAFVLPAAAGSPFDFEFRFWVPNHEMSMCGHATIGAVWLLHRTARIASGEVRISTASGPVIARVDDTDPDHVTVEISQPEGVVEQLDDAEALRAEMCEVLGTSIADLAARPLLNARTSRVKTLVPMRSEGALRALTPRFERIEELCTRIGSTGLYPYAVVDRRARRFEARQFPQSSGYPEDPATGIAAAALAFGLLHDGLVDRSSEPISVAQGVSMGRPSAILVRFDDREQGGGCWVGGSAELESSPTSLT